MFACCTWKLSSGLLLAKQRFVCCASKVLDHQQDNILTSLHAHAGDQILISSPLLLPPKMTRAISCIWKSCGVTFRNAAHTLTSPVQEQVNQFCTDHLACDKPSQYVHLRETLITNVRKINCLKLNFCVLYFECWNLILNYGKLGKSSPTTTSSEVGRG